MAKERILIAVKTYPTISEKYKELACTAGFRPDGSWMSYSQMWCMGELNQAALL
jgi:hypothetical protein